MAATNTRKRKQSGTAIQLAVNENDLAHLADDFRDHVDQDAKYFEAIHLAQKELKDDLTALDSKVDKNHLEMNAKVDQNHVHINSKLDKHFLMVAAGLIIVVLMVGGPEVAKLFAKVFL